MLKIGRINKGTGKSGEAVISLYDGFPTQVEDIAFMVELDGLPVPLYIEAFERRGQSGAVVSFADIDSPRRLEEFLGRDIFLPDTDVEGDDDEFMLEDLIGFKACGEGWRGEVTDFYDSDKNPLWEITVEGRQILIPAVEEFIWAIDFEGRSIEFQLPEGLLEL